MCISYITFFFMLENGYHYVYSELNDLNNKLNLKLPHDKPPRRTKFLNDLWAIRNFSIAHWAGTEKKNLADSIAGQSWGMVHGVKTHHQFRKWEWDIEYVVPLMSKYPMESIPEMHSACSRYLDEFERVCYEYLSAIKMKLPITLNNIYMRPPDDIRISDLKGRPQRKLDRWGRSFFMISPY